METSQAIILRTNRGEYYFTLILPAGTTWADAIAATAELYNQVCDMAKQAITPQNADQPAQEAEVIETVEGEVHGNQ